MARAWLIDGRGLAKKVTHASVPSTLQIKDCGATRECPNCNFLIDNSDVIPEWPGLPLGVRFDPSDEELIEHLSAKCGVGNLKPHKFIDEFIPTLDSDLGINYTHPENLPGANKDGSSIFFFHKTANAYGTGQRKRRKIHCQNSVSEEPVRWHKTGKTKPVLLSGVQKGSKKIMVLYKSSKKGTKPEKSNWVMHQYHLGTEDEEQGEYVVSRIFYQQQKQNEKGEEGVKIEEIDNLGFKTGPTTPNPNPPNPPRPGKSIMYDDALDDTISNSSVQVLEQIAQLPEDHQPANEFGNKIDYGAWLAGESQALEGPGLTRIDDTLLCKENIDSFSVWNTPGKNRGANPSVAPNMKDVGSTSNGPLELPDLDNFWPDFELTDLQLGSQDSFFSWLDKV